MSSTPPNTRSVKIGQDERGGWSSDRPRPGGARPANISTRCRLLTPTDRLRYSPGSLVVVVSPSAAVRNRFVERLIEDRSSLLSLAKVRALIAGRVPDEVVDERAAELLTATVQKRLASSDTVVIPVESLDPAEREPFVRAAAAVMDIPRLRVIDTGLDPVTAEREQWDDGNNTLAIAPRVAVAYERNHETNARLEEAGIEVVRIAGSELGSGRGGPRCMSCPVTREPVPVPAD